MTTLLRYCGCPAATLLSENSYKSNRVRDGFPNNATSVRLSEALEPYISKLREQHEELSDLLQSASPSYLHHRTPFQETIDEEGLSTPLQRSQASWKSVRSSMSTVPDSMFFDAEEGGEFGAEEYIVQDDQEEGTSIKEIPSMSTISASTQEEEEQEYDGIITEDVTPEETPALPVDRRRQLPARPPSDEGSLFTILKKNVGQVCLSIDSKSSC